MKNKTEKAFRNEDKEKTNKQSAILSWRNMKDQKTTRNMQRNKNEEEKHQERKRFRQKRDEKKYL